jgi:hypothetical protein
MRSLSPIPVAVLWILSSVVSVRAGTCENGTFDSTFELIQKAIFENRSCADSLCHGTAKSGGLDLRDGASYDSLVDVPAGSVPGAIRVVAGQKDKSLLWLNLAAKSQPEIWTAPLRPMPLDPIPALTEDELEAVRLWIERGAPRTGVIPGTDQLLDACLPPPEPLEANPLPPPAPGTGVQIKMPRWILEAHSEHEVCLASYYDVTDQVPPQFRGPSGTTFRYKRNQVRQDPLSHHLIVNLYTGNTAPTSPLWGAFKCQGGTRNGQTCDPTDMGFCGADAGCATDPVIGINCIGFGPPDSGVGINSAGISGTQETGYEFDYFDGVYGELPLKGMIMWNHHAFNLTDKDGKLEAWLNFDFAAPDAQLWPAQGIFNTDNIFKMAAPAFGKDYVCDFNRMPPRARLYELSSHTHKRGKRFQIFLGEWRCASGAKAGQPCPASGADDFCGGGECVASEHEQVGDCDFSNAVTVNELVLAVNVALGQAPDSDCREADSDGDGRVAVNELVRAVNAATHGVPPATQRDPDDSYLYLNQIYNDPIILRMDPPMDFANTDSGDLLTLTYCSEYDNGATDPAEVKRRSTSPPNPYNIPGFGGPCQTPTGCTAGKIGNACSGSNEAARNASCDSSDGAGDGECDACPLSGGVTTEDEMFVLLGEYYVPTP